MKRIALTFTELLIALIILAILTSFSIAGFRKVVEANNDRICQLNLTVLEAAIDVYTVENDALPDSLARLELRHIQLAYLKVLGHQPENNCLFSIKGFFGIKNAVAGTLGKYYGNDLSVLVCPSDPDHRQKINKIKANTFVTDTDTSYFRNTGSGNTFTSKDDLTTRNTYAIIYDKSAWHKKGLLLGQSYANGISPTSIEGEIDNDTKKVKKISACDKNADGELTEDECDTHECKKLLKKTKKTLRKKK